MADREELKKRVAAVQERIAKRQASAGADTPGLSPEERRRRLEAAQARLRGEESGSDKSAGEDGDYRPSFWGSIGDLVTGVPGALWEMGKSTVSTAHNWGSSSGFRGQRGTIRALSDGNFKGAYEHARKNTPLADIAVDQAKSYWDTANRLPYYSPMAAAAVADWVGQEGAAEWLRDHADEFARYTHSPLAPLAWFHDSETQQRYKDDIQYRPVASAIEDIGNVASAAALAAGGIGIVGSIGTKSATGVSRRAALKALTQSRGLRAQVDDILKKADEATAPHKVALREAERAGDAARVSEIKAAIAREQAPYRSRAQAMLREADELANVHAKYASTRVGQITEALDRISGMANRVDPTNYVASTGYRFARAAAVRTARELVKAINKLPADHAVRRVITEIGDGVRRIVESRIVRTTLANFQSQAARERLAAEMPFRQVFEEMENILPDKHSQTVSSLIAFGEAETFMLSPTLMALLEEGGPAAQKYIDDAFYKHRAPGEQVPTLAQVQEAIAFVRGELDPERRAVLQQAVNLWHKAGRLADEQYLLGRGESKLPSDAELARRRFEDVEGRAPRASVVDEATAAARKRLDEAEARAARSQARAEEAARLFDEHYKIRPRTPAQVGRAVADQGASAREVASMTKVERVAMSNERALATARNLRKEAAEIRKEADARVEAAAAPRPRTDAQAVQAGRKYERALQQAKADYARAAARDARADQLVDDIITKELGRGWKSVENLREQAAYIRKRAEYTEVFAPDPTEGRMRPGNLTDRDIQRAQKSRDLAAYKERKADLVEAFAPDPASARGKAMERLLRRGARDGAEMAAQFAKVQQLAKQAEKDAKAAAVARRNLERVTERAMNSVKAAPPRYQPLMFELKRMQGQAKRQMRNARLSYAKTLIKESPELAQKIAGNRELTAQNVARGLAYNDTRLSKGATIDADVKAALDDLLERHPEMVVHQQILAEMSLGVQSLIDADINPAFATGGFVPSKKQGPGVVHSPQAGPTVRRLAAENEKVAGVLPRTAEQALQLRLREIRKGVQNETARRMINKWGVIVDDVLGDLDEVTVDLEDGRTVTYTREELANLSGPALAEVMRQQGYEALDVRPRQGDDFLLPDTDVTQGTVFVHRDIISTFEREFSKDWDNLFLRGYDAGTSAWKTLALAFSPRWWVNNTGGNSLMLLMAGVRPWDAIGNLPKVRRLIKDLREGKGDPELLAVLDPGLHGERRSQIQLSENRVKRGIQKAARKSWAINQYIDDMYRLTLYLERRGRGFSPEQAVRDALKVFGDYQNMTRLERQAARRVFSFYSWTKTITKYALSLPIEHPVRTAWMLTLSDRYGQEELPGFVRGIMFGGLLIPTGGMDPFGSLAEGDLTPRGMFRSFNPFIRLGYTAATGQRLEGGQMYLPPGVDPNALDTRLDVIREELWNLTPQGRVIRGRDGIRRYATGDPMFEGNSYMRRERWDAPWGTLPYIAEDTLRLLGVPYPRPYDIEEERLREERRRRQDERLRLRYEQRRAQLR